MKMKTVDVFCGVGGLSYGFKKEGFEIKAGIDSDRSCRYAYETNIGSDFLEMDVTSITGSKLNKLFGARRRSYRILIGCAPCQPFSIYTGRYKKAKQTDGRWQLLDQFARLVAQTKPHVVSMENVARLSRHRVFKKFVLFDRDRAGPAYPAIVSFTTATSCLSVKGFARNAGCCPPGGRFFWNASSA